MKYAFISYDSVDRSAADDLRNLLNKNSIKTWMAPYDAPPWGISPGFISYAIRDCACFILLVSNAAVESESLKKEFETALSNCRSVVPIATEDISFGRDSCFASIEFTVVRISEEDSTEVKAMLSAVKGFVSEPENDKKPRKIEEVNPAPRQPSYVTPSQVNPAYVNPSPQPVNPNVKPPYDTGWNRPYTPDNPVQMIRCPYCSYEVPSDMVFCPCCGNKITVQGPANGPAASKPALQLSKVEFSAVAPKHMVKGEYSIIDIVMYEQTYRHIVDEIHKQSEAETQEKRSGMINVQAESDIKVVLTSSDIEIEDNEMTGVWQGSYLDFSFPVYLPEDYAKKQVMFIAKIYINGLLATRLTFAARISSLFRPKIDVRREDVTNAFISYASQDRERVASIVQGMQNARRDMHIFFDINSLRSGDNWEDIIFDDLKKSDVLYLCWSDSAKKSPWVDKEWRYVYGQKGEDGIEPMPIELPENCPPPAELSRKHWNDMLLYVIEHYNKGGDSKK